MSYIVDSLWNDSDAKAMVARYAARGIAEDLSLRTYTSRLLGANKWLVMHGGGNTSVKTEMHDVYGDLVNVLCVKGSGWDLATIEPEGHPAVRLDPLFKLRQLDRLTDEDMVNAQRQNMLDTTGPNPSVETLLHAYIPLKFVDHAHSTASIAIADQPNPAEIGRRIWGQRVGYVPYVMPGFALAKAAAEAFEADPTVEGLLLEKHGVFAFGPTARSSYERMIDLVTDAENFIARHGQRRLIQVPALREVLTRSAILPTLRGLVGEVAKDEQIQKHWIFEHRDTARLMQVVNAQNLDELAKRGVATPDHVIRTKAFPLVLARPSEAPVEWTRDTRERLHTYINDYKAMFERQNARVGGGKRSLDALPRVVLVPGVGAFGLGKTAREATVVADIVEAWAASLVDAESIGSFRPVGEDDVFDMEYWSLEQAKLGKSVAQHFAGHIVVVTGAGSGIGAATARAFAAEGAEVALLDRDIDSATAIANKMGKTAFATHCDVTDVESVRNAMAAVVERFGGVDIVVSNAGSAFQGPIASIDFALFQQSMAVNLYGHHFLAQAAVAVMREQKMGGALLFNVSKQAINPGKGFGPYGIAKAALLALVKQYALEHGEDGIRCNAVNADRIRSNLLTDAMIKSRADARGVSIDDYMGGNLLGREVTVDDVAQAFIAQAKMQSTTGDITTVDGGNVSAMMR